MPIASVVVDAKTSDSTMLIPCLEQLDKLDTNLPNMIADMAYIGGEDKITAMKKFRGIKKVEIYLKLVDAFRLMTGMLHHAEEYFVPDGRADLLRELAEQAIYDRVVPDIKEVA